MRVSKYTRQSRILEIIETQPISTQEELVAELAAEGFQVTQATISRDIKELGIVKTTHSEGAQRFTAMNRDYNEDNERLMRVFVEAVVSFALAQNILVVHTLPGMASASAAGLDSMKLSAVAGTLAGDDTIFIACHSEADARRLQEHLMRVSVRQNNRRGNEGETDAEEA